MYRTEQKSKIKFNSVTETYYYYATIFVSESYLRFCGRINDKLRSQVIKTRTHSRMIAITLYTIVIASGKERICT